MKFKSEYAASGFGAMRPRAKGLAEEMSLWLEVKGVEMIVTETVTTLDVDRKLGRVSDTHRTGRAFDIRVKDWTGELKQEFLSHFRELYNDSLGAVTSKGPQLIVDKSHGSGPHFHVQIKRGL